MSDYQAGGGDKLRIVRHSRDEMVRYERQATEQIQPGQALERTTDGNGDAAFQKHTGTDTKAVYVALDARGRGMDAQTHDGYAAGDEVVAVAASGGGLNLLVSDGENVTDGDPLVVSDTTAGEFRREANNAGAPVVGHASEDNDLSGASDAGLTGAEME